MKRSFLSKQVCIIFLLWLAATLASYAQTFTSLHSFTGSDGSAPLSGLIQGADGNFYGTTSAGGSSGSGTIFQMTPSGTLTILQSFTYGSSAPTRLTQGSDGKFYGMTGGGGTATYCVFSTGCGTLYSIVPGGTPTILYNFCTVSTCSNGYNPVGFLLQTSDGAFYGITSEKAEPNGCVGNCGTVFKVAPGGTPETIATFTESGGFSPNNGLIHTADGNFYGTTEYGGNDICGDGQALFCGTIFKLTSAGALTTLYSFCPQHGCSDGFLPSSLVLGQDGNFYGTTSEGGGTETSYPYGSGTVFKITPEGVLTTLHVFCTQANCPDGSSPQSLVAATDGNLYGITASGGNNTACSYGSGCGTIFKIMPQGTFLTLYSFDNSTGKQPSGLIQASDGTFYGTTASGGSNGGTIFQFSIGLGGTTSSTVRLGLSSSSAVVGSAGPIVMTAQVAPTAGSGSPTGVVAFYSGSNEIGSASLSGGVATYSYNPGNLALGAYSITAIYSGDATFSSSISSPESLAIVPITLPQTATPSFSVPQGTYTSAQTVALSDATPGATIYYTTDGSTPTTNSAVYSAPLTISSTETLNTIALANGYTQSAVATAVYTINISPTAPVLSNFSPAYISAGSASFTITVTGSGFTPDATIYWASTALTTKYGSSTQLTAQIPASDIASAGTASITIQIPERQGSISNPMQFEIDSSSSTSFAPTFVTTQATVGAGSSGIYSINLPASTTNVSATCLNLPAGATCSYSASSHVMTISTTAATPKGTYQITIVFTETVPSASVIASFLPILLCPLLLLGNKNKSAARNIWLTGGLGMLLLICAASVAGCGGGPSNAAAPTSPTPQTQTVTSSGTVTLTIQ